MFRSIEQCVFGFSLIAGLMLSRLAGAAETIPALGMADAMELDQTIDPQTGHGESHWISEGWGTLIGHHFVIATTRFNAFTGKITGGEFNAESLDFPGTSISGTFEGKWRVLGGGPLVQQNTILIWTSGTGIAAGVTGKAQARSVEFDDGDPDTPDPFHYEYHGFFRFNE